MHCNKNKFTYWNMPDFPNNDIPQRMTGDIIKNITNNRVDGDL